METPSIRSEDTSSEFSPPSSFNIADAFPGTDEIVRKVARAKWQRRFEHVLSKPSTLVYLAAGLLGFVIAARSSKY